MAGVEALPRYDDFKTRKAVDTLNDRAEAPAEQQPAAPDSPSFRGRVAEQITIENAPIRRQASLGDTQKQFYTQLCRLYDKDLTD